MNQATQLRNGQDPARHAVSTLSVREKKASRSHSSVCIDWIRHTTPLRSACSSSLMDPVAALIDLAVYTCEVVLAGFGREHLASMVWTSAVVAMLQRRIVTLAKIARCCSQSHLSPLELFRRNAGGGSRVARLWAQVVVRRWVFGTELGGFASASETGRGGEIGRRDQWQNAFTAQLEMTFCRAAPWCPKCKKDLARTCREWSAVQTRRTWERKLVA